MLCYSCATNNNGVSRDCQTLLKSFQKLKSKEIFDSTSFNSEIVLLNQLLQRNADQHHSRKYYRLSSQLSKKCSNLCKILDVYLNSFKSLYLQLKESCIHVSECDGFLLKSKDTIEHISNTLNFSLKVLFELQRYLANCEFVKVLVALVAVVSKLYALISQPLRNIKKIINVLSHHNNPISPQEGSDTSPAKLLDTDSTVYDLQVSANEADEDLGEVVDVSELQDHEIIAPCLEGSPQTSNGSSAQDSKVEEGNVSELKQQQYVKSEINDCCKFLCQSEKTVCSTLKSRKSTKTRRVIVRRPTYKVYKERHPFFRKLARYSSDLLRRDLPDYSISLYLSL